VETLVAKLFTPLPAATPVGLSYAAGNFGDAEGREDRRGALQRPLVVAEWLLASLAAAAWLVSRRGLPPRPRRRLRTALGAAAAAVLAVLAWLVIGLPQRVPAPQLAAAVVAAVPPLPRGEPSARAELIERGRYLFTVSSCMFCHGADGAGGAKVSWKPFGTLWARNISSDRETGLGAWSDAEVARAIRSGIARGGRPLHWQGMTWDLLSNLDEEDVRALTAYLRTLPPVRKAVPEPRPPAPDDCDVYTFFLRGAPLGRPGCR
jgi:mono/diheme cytochrome c family protein